MAELTGQLLVPISLQALVITQEIVDRFGWLRDGPSGTSTLDVGKWLPTAADYARTATRLDSAGPAPFFGLLDPGAAVAGPGAADLGVYLQWVVPDRLRHARQLDDGSLEFPPLPDQWLVVRFARRTGGHDPAAVAAWFIDAGLLVDDADADGASLLWPDPASQGYAAHRVGRVYALAGTAQAPRLGDARLTDMPRVPAPLTGTGNAATGAPTFTARVMDSQNVLSWHDGLGDWGSAPPDDLALSYVVLGWHRDARADPLRRTLQTLAAPPAAGQEATAILAALGWQVGADPGAVPPADLSQWTCVYHGMVAYINYWSQRDYQGPLLGYPGAPFIHGGAAPDRAPMTVGVGNSTADALVALVAEKTAAEDENRAALWELLEAAIYRQMPTVHSSWQETLRDFAVHQSWFTPQPAGYSWTIAAQERDPHTLSVPGAQQKPGVSPQASAAQLDALLRLNQAQAAYNAQARSLSALQQDFYARWWSLARRRLLADPFGTDPPDRSVEAGNLAAFGQALQPGWTGLGTAYQALASAYQSMQGLVRDSGFNLPFEGEPRFWQPADPTIVVYGVGRQDKHRTSEVLVCRAFGPAGPAGTPAGGLLQAVTVALHGAASTTWNTPAGTSAVRDAAARSFPNIAGPAGALLDEASLLEQALTGLCAGTRSQETSWQAWADRLQADVTWDGTGSAPADTITLAGVDGGPAALSRLVSLWVQQPWAPLHLDWQITFYPSQGTAEGFGPDWQPADHDYVPATGQPASTAAYTVRGRSLMAPAAGRLLTDPVQEVIDLLSQKDEAGLAAFDIAIKRALLQNAAAWNHQLEELESDGLLGQTLTGFHQAFLGRSLMAPRIAPDAAYPWVPGSLSDFGDAALRQRGWLSQPNVLPAALVPDGEPAADHPLIVKPLAPASQEDTENVLPFSLVRAGSFSIDHLWMVDDFGQWVELVGGTNVSTGIVVSPHCAWPAAAGRLALPPRIVQPARLDFRFVAAGDSQTASDLHPDTHPICGWVYANYLDQALTICDETGHLLGELALVDDGKGGYAVRWECLVKGKAPETSLAALGADPTLNSFVAALADPTPQPRQKLQDLLDLIDQRVATIRTGSESHRFRLAGRPLALVNARVGLELFGAAWQDPSPDKATRPAAPGAGSGDPALDRLRLPVQLGHAGLESDGLIGYYIRSGGSSPAGMSRIIPAGGPLLPQTGSTGYVSPDPNADAVTVGFGAPAAVTLLMDPNAAVHASARIVPAKAITLPAAFIEQARSALEFAVRVGPALLYKPLPDAAAAATGPSAALNVPVGLAGQWRFRSPLAPEGATVLSPATQPSFSGALPLAVEGRLVLETASPPQARTLQMPMIAAVTGASGQPSVALSGPATFAPTDSDNMLPLHVADVNAGGGNEAVQAFQLTLLVPRSILAFDAEIQRLQSGAVKVVSIPQSLGDHTGNWSTWLQLPNQDSAYLIQVRLLNNVDANQQPVPQEKWGSLQPGGVYLKLPLKPVGQQTAVEIRYSYAGKPDPASLELSLVPPTQTAPAQVPELTLNAMQGERVVQNVYALELGTELSIAWQLAKGPWQAIAGTLMGPLPFGRHELALEPGGPYPPDQGEVAVSIVADQAYAVQVTVKMADGTRLSVIRSLALSVFSPAQYGALSLTPQSILPYGPITAHWAAWGVLKANLAIDYPDGTLQNFNQDVLARQKDPTVAAQGQGEQDFPAPPYGETTARLTLWIKDAAQPAVISQQVTVETWGDLALENWPNPRAIAMTYDQAGWLLFCTADGMLYRARVGVDDTDRSQDKRCVQVGQLPNTARWLAATGFPDTTGFAALRIRTTGETELVLFDAQAQPVGPGITLANFAGIARGQLVATQSHIYVTGVIEMAQPGPYAPRVVAPTPISYNRQTGDLGEELALLAARGAALLTLDGALYALHPETGDLLCFDYDGTALGWPKAAAPAPADVAGKFALAKGVPVAVEDVLVVVGSGQGDQAQDRVYSARYDTWTTCGHGLQLDGGVLAYRGGASKRLFALGGVRLGGKAGDHGQTLSLPDYLDMFAPAALSANPPVSLVNDYLDHDLIFPNPFPAAVPAAPAVTHTQAIDGGMPEDLRFALIARGEGDLESLSPFVVTLAEDGSLRLSYHLDGLPVGFLGLQTRAGAYWYYLYEDAKASGRLGLWPIPRPVVEEIKALPLAFPGGSDSDPSAGDFTFMLHGKVSPSLVGLPALAKPALDAASSPDDRTLRLSELARRALPTLSLNETAGSTVTAAALAVGPDGAFAIKELLTQSTADTSYVFRVDAGDLAGPGSASLSAERVNAFTVRLTNADLAGFNVDEYQKG
jgi:hypothetical protein